MNKLLSICLIGLLIALAAIYIFNVPVNNILFFALVLACPLMHVFMGHGSHGTDTKKENKQSHH